MLSPFCFIISYWIKNRKDNREREGKGYHDLLERRKNVTGRKIELEYCIFFVFRSETLNGKRKGRISNNILGFPMKWDLLIIYERINFFAFTRTFHCIRRKHNSSTIHIFHSLTLPNKKDNIPTLFRKEILYMFYKKFKILCIFNNFKSYFTKNQQYGVDAFANVQHW